MLSGLAAQEERPCEDSPKWAVGAEVAILHLTRSCLWAPRPPRTHRAPRVSKPLDGGALLVSWSPGDERPSIVESEVIGAQVETGVTPRWRSWNSSSVSDNTIR